MKLPVKELSRKLSCLFFKKRGRNPHPDRKYTCRLRLAAPGAWAACGERSVRRGGGDGHNTMAREAGLGASEVGS